MTCTLRGADVTAPAVLTARNWDLPVIVGSGGYRGVKSITTENRKHRIEPGVLIEKAHFDGKRNPQWEIAGALLRDTKFNGDLGARLAAKDSVFESCHLSKSGGWFVQWWGTKWRFENCVFSKSFMPAGFGIHDYSVRAVECTFIGVKLPKFGLKNPEKDEPANYLGKENLQFVRCRFIGCEVPENALAATVDCLFEDCKFEKGKFAWDKAKQVVKVNAFVPAGPVPESYTNGVLRVTFTAGGAPNPAGAKLAFTQTAERLLVPWAQQITKFSEIGVEDKLASTMPAPEVFTNNAGGPPSKDKPMRPVTGPNSFLNLPDPDPVPKPKPPTVPAAPVRRR
jgi:hypothetical protein